MNCIVDLELAIATIPASAVVTVPGVLNGPAPALVTALTE